MFRVVRMARVSALAAGLLWSAAANPALAATSTGSVQVSMTIQAECKLQAGTTTLQFGSRGVLDAVVDAQASFGLQCTNSTPFSIGLDAGQGSGATVGARAMTGPAGALVGYTMYRDSGRSQVWGQTANIDALASTGTGALQSFTIYGRVPAQTTPAPGSFSDLVALTVTY